VAVFKFSFLAGFDFDTDLLCFLLDEDSLVALGASKSTTLGQYICESCRHLEVDGCKADRC